MALAQTLNRLSMWSLEGVVGCPDLCQCCMDGCEKSVRGLWGCLWGCL